MNVSFQTKLRLNPGGMQAARTRALREIGEDILRRSQRITPLRTGRLIASGRAEVDGNRAIVRYTAPYALYVHEDTRAHHANGQAKYLATALKAPATLEAATKACARALRGD